MRSRRSPAGAAALPGGSYNASTLTWTANQGLHYAIGIPTPFDSLPVSGSTGYALLAATHPTIHPNDVPPGMVTAGSAEVSWGEPVSTLSLSLSVTTSAGDYSIATSGLATNAVQKDFWTGTAIGKKPSRARQLGWWHHGRMARCWWAVLVALSGCGSGAEEVARGEEESDAPKAPLDCPSPPPASEASGVLEGDLTIGSAAHVAGAARLSEVTGSLRILPAFSGVLDLPNLKRVGGDVRLEGHAVAGEPQSEWAGITELRLPNLQSIGGELHLYLTGSLVETDFRRLETVGSRVYFMRNLALRRIGLDSITTGPVDIQASPLAASCEIEAICAQIGGLGCGAEYSDPDCSCVKRCDRLEPVCGE